MSSDYSPAFEYTPETYVDSPPSTPESYKTGDGGSLPPSPGGRERVLPQRRAFSVDAALDRKRGVVAEMSSATSGVVDLITSEASQEEDMRPHKPFGLMGVAEAWGTLATSNRLWFPIPHAWRDIPELEGTAIYFNKYPSPYLQRAFPQVERIHELEPSIADQDLLGCRKNITKIGEKLLATLQRTIVLNSAITTTDTEVRIQVAEVPPQNPFPSHLLIIEQDPPIRGERHRTFVPVHDVVFLCFVSGIKLPPRLNARPVQKGDRIEITVPIVRFGMPSPVLFENLLKWMYSAQNTASHMAFFDCHLAYLGLPQNARSEATTGLPRLLRLPFLRNEDKDTWIEWSKHTEGRMAAQWAMTYSYERLISLMKEANLQYENLVSIQIHDNVLEAALLLCRRITLSAMCLSVVRDHLV